MFKLRCIYDVNFNYDLGWYVSWFEILHDFTDYQVIRA
jgi:hypothetical protein